MCISPSWLSRELLWALSQFMLTFWSLTLLYADAVISICWTFVMQRLAYTVLICELSLGRSLAHAFPTDPSTENNKISQIFSHKLQDKWSQLDNSVTFAYALVWCEDQVTDLGEKMRELFLHLDWIFSKVQVIKLNRKWLQIFFKC